VVLVSKAVEQRLVLVAAGCRLVRALHAR
jgi:hypothetical protein